jgi:DNA recombination protein RmuC
MELLMTILGIGVLMGIAFVIYKLKDLEKNEGENRLMLEYIEALRKEIRESSTDNRNETQNKLDKLDDRLARGLEVSSKTLQKQFEQSSDMIKDITKELSELKGTNKQVLGFSEQLQSLENILKNPKQRGILGEYFLESLLAQVFQPNQYKMQYKFKNGEIVDAVIFFNDKIIPVDAKFSLEKYNKITEENDKGKRELIEKDFKLDIKNRIDETSKYVREDEDTTDFAFMFIPAEGVYYNLLTYKVGNSTSNSKDLIKYAFEKHVIIVSPSSFYAYLSTVLQGLKALKMEDSVKKIMQNVSNLDRHMKSYDESFRKMGGHLATTVSMYNNSSREFKKIDKDIYKITDGEKGGEIETILIDKPKEEV